MKRPDLRMKPAAVNAGASSRHSGAAAYARSVRRSRMEGWQVAGLRWSLKIALAVGAFILGGCGASTGPDDLIIANPHEAVRAARAMIEERRADSSKYSEMLFAKDLPPTLQVPGLRYAYVHRDHVDLVLARNPDWDVGGRIWAQDHRPHEDRPTRYPEIYFYDYTNDSPESPANIH